MPTLRVCAPAKVNLTLDVLGRRPDGYHEIVTIMQAIDLCDTILLSRCAGDGSSSPECSLSVAAAGRPDAIDVSAVPVGEGNLAWRALRALEQRSGRRLPVSIGIEKAIPVAAGLGGGSADAAAVLWGVNRLYGLGLSLENLIELASGIGADVPFFLMGGTVLATGKGERLTPLPRRDTGWAVTLVKPDLAVSTAEVYVGLGFAARDPVPAGPHPAGTGQHLTGPPDTEGMMAALRTGDFASACQSLGNVLERVTLARHPEVRRLRDRLRAAGAAGVLMSGSGPTVFALARSREEAGRIADAMAGETSFVAVTEFDGMGVRECPHV